MVSLCAVFLICVYLGFEFPNRSFTFPALHFLLWFFEQTFFVLSIDYALWKSYFMITPTIVQKTEQKDFEASGESSASSSIVFTCMDILTKPEFAAARAQYTHHLVREFSVENILFFTKTCEFFDLSQYGEISDEEISLRAVAIYYQFIHEECPNQVSNSLSCC